MADNHSNTQGITLTAEGLKELIATAIAAAKAPNVVEQKQLDEQAKSIEIAQAQRQALSESIQDGIRQKRETQRICSHEAPDGHSHLVYIQEKSGPGYLLCQKYQCKIRPGVVPEGYKGNDIYDTTLFNAGFQKTIKYGDIFA